jgi:hypothetical protein
MWSNRRIADLYAFDAFREADHPRARRGTAQGGQFTKARGGGGASKPEPKREVAKTELAKKPKGFLAKVLKHKLPKSTKATYASGDLTAGAQMQIHNILKRHKIRLPPYNHGESVWRFERMTGLDPLQFREQMLKGLPPKIANRLELSVNAQQAPGYGTFVEYGLVSPDGGIQIQRTIDPVTGVAQHDVFELPNDLQGKGFAKQFMRNSLDFYDHLGLKKMEVGANIDVGGYAWARYGFVPTKKSWNELRNGPYAGLRRNTKRVYGENVPANVKTLLASEDPKTIRKIAALPEGKELLKGTSWHGEFDLNDKAAYKVLRMYVAPGMAKGAKHG